MESETNQESFGSYLKSFRIDQNIAVETIAGQTKIAVHCLKAIEEDALDRLPPKAYVISFLRTYAKAVGANADVALDLYRSHLARQASDQQRIRKKRANVAAIRRALLAVGLITAILLLLRYTDLLLDPTPAGQPEMINPATLSDQAPPGNVPVTAGSLASPHGVPLKLKIVAVENTWLKVIVDGKTTRSYTLKPEDRLELEGTDNFDLMIGNATGLNIYLDDRPVKIFGRRGQVVSLKIP